MKAGRYAIRRPPLVARCDLNESAYPPLPTVATALAEQARRRTPLSRVPPGHSARGDRNASGVDPAAVTVGAGGTAVAFTILQDCLTRTRTRRPRISPRYRRSTASRSSPGMLGATIDPSPLTPSGDSRPRCSPRGYRPRYSRRDPVFSAPTGAIIGNAEELRAFVRRSPLPVFA